MRQHMDRLHQARLTGPVGARDEIEPRPWPPTADLEIAEPFQMQLLQLQINRSAEAVYMRIGMMTCRARVSSASAIRQLEFPSRSRNSAVSVRSAARASRT